MNGEEIISRLSKYMVEKQSFKYDSFKNAKITVNIDEFSVTFDAFSMLIYKHNLSVKHRNLLYKEIVHSCL